MAAPTGKMQLDLSSRLPLDLSSRLPQTPAHVKSQWKPASDTNWLLDALAAKLPPTPAAAASTRCEWRPSSDTSWLIKRKPQAEEGPLSVGVDEFPGARDLEESLMDEAPEGAQDAVKLCGEGTSPSTSWASDSEEESDVAAASGPKGWASWASETDEVETEDLEAESDGATGGAELPVGLPLTEREPKFFQDFQEAENDGCAPGFFAPQPYVECGYVPCGAEEPMTVSSMFGDMCSYMMPMVPMAPALPEVSEQHSRTPLRAAPAFLPASLMAPMGPPQGRVAAKSTPSKPSSRSQQWSTRRVGAQIPGEVSPWWSTMSHQRGPADVPRVKVGQCVLVSA
jgi:hypothetical protein